jgi:hypothetical protein
VRAEAARAAVERAEADEDADGLAQRMADMEAAWQACDARPAWLHAAPGRFSTAPAALLRA